MLLDTTATAMVCSCVVAAVMILLVRLRLWSRKQRAAVSAPCTRTTVATVAAASKTPSCAPAAPSDATHSLGAPTHRSSHCDTNGEGSKTPPEQEACLSEHPEHQQQQSTAAEEVSKQLVSVNWHFTRICNYKCDFCYHVNTNPFVHAIPEGKRAIRLLHDAGTKKLNFSGGEPFMHPKRLGAWCREAKLCGMYVSIITNGSKVTEAWIAEHHKYVDMLGVSVDSASDDTHEELGRWDYSNATGHIAGARRVADWCHTYGIAFKVNTVVTKRNVLDDMGPLIGQLNPVRWKIFQMLLIKGENVESEHRADATDLAITETAFQAFIDRHRASVGGIMKVEDNVTMRNSYVILNERLKFLDNSEDTKTPSRFSILDVGVVKAFASTFFDAAKFRQRDGDFFVDRDRSDDLEDRSSSAGETAASRSIPDLEDL